MLRAEPSNWFSWGYDVLENNRHLTTVDLAWVREAGSFELEGQHFHISREPGWGDFVLTAKGNVICRAKKLSAWFRSFQVVIGGQQLTLEAASPFHRAFVLSQAGATVGEIRPQGILSRKAVVALPESLSRAIQVFLLWLVIIMWRRQSNAATS